MLIAGGWGSGKTNSLINLVRQQPDIDKIYLYAEGPYEAKYKFLIPLNHSSDIDYKEFMNLYNKCTAKPYSFLVIHTTLASDNPSCFRKNLLERI